MMRSDAKTRNSAQAALLTIVVLAIAVIIILGLAFLGVYVANYNRAIRLNQAANEAWANVDALLQRRFDLVPNLVETVKGYASQEKEIFETVAEARTRYFQADKTGSIEGKIEASNELSGALSRLLFLQEAYPQLKSNQNFLALQDQLEGTENRIAVARTRYNEAVRELNAYVQSFWGSFFAARAGVKTKPSFEAAPTAQQAPKVEFPAPAPRSAPAPQPAPAPQSAPTPVPAAPPPQ
jgi:LemA protein